MRLKFFVEPWRQRATFAVRLVIGWSGLHLLNLATCRFALVIHLTSPKSAHDTQLHKRWELPTMTINGLGSTRWDSFNGNGLPFPKDIAREATRMEALDWPILSCLPLQNSLQECISFTNAPIKTVKNLHPGRHPLLASWVPHCICLALTVALPCGMSIRMCRSRGTQPKMQIYQHFSGNVTQPQSRDLRHLRHLGQKKGRRQRKMVASEDD